MDELSVFKLATNLRLNFDQVEVDVRTFKVCNCKHRIDADSGKLVLPAAHDLRTKSSAGSLAECCLAVGLDVHLLRNVLHASNCHLTRFLIAMGDAQWVNALLNETHGLVK